VKHGLKDKEPTLTGAILEAGPIRVQNCREGKEPARAGNKKGGEGKKKETSDGVRMKEEIRPNL